MFTVEEVSSKDFMGFIWFEVFKNGRPTGNFVTAKDAKHAIRIYKQFYK